MAKEKSDQVLEQKVSKIFNKKPLQGQQLAEKKATDPKAEVKLPAKVVVKPKAKEEIGQANKATIVQRVISTRELKYIYPKNCITATGRKAYRAQVRGKIQALTAEIAKLKGADRVAAKEALDAYTRLHLA